MSKGIKCLVKLACGFGFISTEMYPGFQIWGSSGLLLEKLGIHCRILGVHQINIQELIFKN